MCVGRLTKLYESSSQTSAFRGWLWELTNGLPISAFDSRFPLLQPFPSRDRKKPGPSSHNQFISVLLAKAKAVTVVCEGSYAPSKMQERNEWMVDRCDKLIAVWDGSAGGTGNCVKYAESVGKDIFYISPRLDV